MKLKTKAIEQWVTVEGNEPGEKVEFLVCPLTPKQISSIIRQSTEREWDKNQRFEDVNPYKFKIKKIDAVIRDWKNVEDEDGNPLECDLKNKEIVYIYNVEIIDKALSMAEKLAEIYIMESESIEKNSLIGRDSQPRME